MKKSNIVNKTSSTNKSIFFFLKKKKVTNYENLVVST